MYAIKNEAIDKKFISKASIIKKQMSPAEIMKFLGITDKFIISNENAISYTSRSSYLVENSRYHFSSVGAPQNPFKTEVDDDGKDP
jgi:hypothetical protein